MMFMVSHISNGVAVVHFYPCDCALKLNKLCFIGENAFTPPTLQVSAA